MTQANIDKIYRIAFEEGLKQGCLEKIESFNKFTYLKFMQELKKNIQKQAGDDIFGDGVNKEGKNSFY